MNFRSNLSASNGIIKKAQSFPGVLAGIAAAETLKQAPSYRAWSSVEWKTGAMFETHESIPWPEDAKSVLVLVYGHPSGEPELDWWDGKGTEGNRVLMKVAEQMRQWFESTLHAKADPLPYHVENGGVFLKDAAVLAGLGVIGRNNLLVTPELGPRVRLRALFLSLDLVPTGPIDWFSPCEDCPSLCWKACPQKAFDSGAYSRMDCILQMEENRVNLKKVNQNKQDGTAVEVVSYCRACELACPAGHWEERPVTRYSSRT